MSLSKRLRVAFDKVDSSDDGRINLTELRDCCDELSIDLEEEDIVVFRSCEDGSKPGLSYDGFVKFFQLRLNRIFEELDVDQSGYIDACEISLALARLNVSLSQRQIQGILSGMDKDGNKKIDFDEFCAFFSDIPSPSFKAIAKKWASGCGLDFGTDIVPMALPPAEAPLFQFVIAGGLAGVVSRTFTAPLEKIKLIAQTSSSGYLGIRGTFRNVFVREGLSGLFSGNLTNCIRIFPSLALVCLVYSRMIKYTPVDNLKNPQQPLWRFISGGTAGIFSTVLTHPLDVVRARLTVQDSSTKGSGNYRGIFAAFRTILLEEGTFGFYKGIGPALLSIAPFIGVQQCVYDVVKLKALDSAVVEPEAFTFLCCGAFAGMTAQTVVHPLDVVRRQMQVNRGALNITKSSLSAIRQLWIAGGVPRVYAGLTAAYLKAMPAASMSLLVRDALLGRLGEG